MLRSVERPRRAADGSVRRRVGPSARACACPGITMLLATGGHPGRRPAWRWALRAVRTCPVQERLNLVKRRRRAELGIAAGVFANADVLGVLHSLQAPACCVATCNGAELIDCGTATASAAVPLWEVRKRTHGPRLAAPGPGRVRGASEARGRAERSVRRTSKALGQNQVFGARLVAIGPAIGIFATPRVQGGHLGWVAINPEL
mmetsp:Transcript_26690/g.74528  ORF Transcript_26690/g.74528 Transcript_26690/m.74528 type:complete len:204 (+) Transcript_26690:274-885(+)